MSGEANDVTDSLISLLNDTDSELSGLSHLDAPSEGVYIVCGVLIAMLLVAAIIILLAVFISKLRKRDDGTRHPQDHVILQAAAPPATQHNHHHHHHHNHTNNNHNHHHHNNNNNNNNNNVPQPPPLPAMCNGGTTIPTVSATVIYPPPPPQPQDVSNQQPPRQFIWQLPAPHPFAMYNNDKETLVHPLPAEQPGFCRGFRKNLQGRWKRLVKRKPINETYAIPPELRDQLKNIYVY